VREAKRLLADARPELRGWEWRHLALRADASQHVLGGHTARVCSLDLAPDGRRVASSSDDGSVRVWSLESLRQVLALPPLEEPVFTVAFRRGGAQLLTLDGWIDGRLRLWDVASGRETARIELSGLPSLGAALSQDEPWLAFGTAEELVHVVDLEARREVARLAGHQGSVHAVAFDPLRARLLSASDDGTVRAWRLDSMTEERVFQGPGGPIYALACAPSGEEFATAAADGAVRLWRMDGSVPPEVLWQQEAVAHAVLFGADAQRVVSAWSDKTIRVLERVTGRRAELRGHDGDTRVLAFGADDRWLVSGSDDATLRVWDLVAGRPIAVLAQVEAPSALALRGDGALLAVGSSLSGSIRVFEPGTSEPYALLSTDAAAELDQTNDLAFAPDGTLLAAAYGGAFVRIFRLEDRALVQHLEHPLSVTSLAFHPSATRLATGSASVRIWDAPSGSLLGQLGSDEGSVRDLAWHPGGASVAAAYDEDRVVVWDVARGERSAELVEPGFAATALCWSPDGELLALGGSDQSVRLWWPATGRSVTLAGHEGRVSAIAFQSARRVLSSSLDGSVRVWDLAPGAPGALLALRGHQGAVTALAVSPDGEELFSAGQDGSVKSWRAARP
jgi:WD40 repeat protein